MLKISALLLSLTMASSIFANDNKQIDLMFPPVVFAKVTTIMNEGMKTINEQEKIEAIDDMAFGLYSLPPCKIHTTNAIYSVAQTGDVDVKTHAIDTLEKALKTIPSNLPMPSFVMAKIIMTNYIATLKNEIKL